MWSLIHCGVLDGFFLVQFMKQSAPSLISPLAYKPEFLYKVFYKTKVFLRHQCIFQTRYLYLIIDSELWNSQINYVRCFYFILFHYKMTCQNCCLILSFFSGGGGLQYIFVTHTSCPLRLVCMTPALI